MKEKTFVLLMIFPLLMTSGLGCARQISPPDSGLCTVRTEMDEANNYISVRTERNHLDKGLDLNVWLHQQGENKDLRLVVIYKGLDWLFVEPEETLTLYVDTEKIELMGEGCLEPRSALSRWWIMEMASYEITDEQLRRISYAGEAICIIKNREYALSADNFECLRRIYEEYLAGKAEAEAEPG